MFSSTKDFSSTFAPTFASWVQDLIKKTGWTLHKLPLPVYCLPAAGCSDHVSWSEVRKYCGLTKAHRLDRNVARLYDSDKIQKAKKVKKGKK